MTDDRSLPSAEETAYEVSMAFAERKADSALLAKLKIPAAAAGTARNLNTIAKLTDMAAELTSGD